MGKIVCKAPGRFSKKNKTTTAPKIEYMVGLIMFAQRAQKADEVSRGIIQRFAESGHWDDEDRQQFEEIMGDLVCMMDQLYESGYLDQDNVIDIAKARRDSLKEGQDYLDQKIAEKEK